MSPYFVDSVLTIKVYPGNTQRAARCYFADIQYAFGGTQFQNSDYNAGNRKKHWHKTDPLVGHNAGTVYLSGIAPLYNDADRQNVCVTPFYDRLAS